MLITAADKHGQLGIWDARAPGEEVADEDDDVTMIDREGGKYWRLQLHWPATAKSSMSCIKFDPIDSHNVRAQNIFTRRSRSYDIYQVYTSSYDCTIRSLSFTSGVSRELYASDGDLITSIDLPPTGHEIWMSDTLGGATHLDIREEKRKARWYALSDQKIGCISINPTRPHFLLAASNSRSLK